MSCKDTKQKYFLRALDKNQWCTNHRKLKYVRLACNDGTTPVKPLKFEGFYGTLLESGTVGPPDEQGHKFECRELTWAERMFGRRFRKEQETKITSAGCTDAKYLCAENFEEGEPMQLGSMCTPKCSSGYIPKPNRVVCSARSGGGGGTYFYPPFECVGSSS